MVQIKRVTDGGLYSGTQYDSLLRRIPAFPIAEDGVLEFINKLIKFGYLFVAEQDGRLVGLIGFYANDMLSKVAYVSSFCVAKDVEGRGISRELFERFLVLARSSGMTAVSLNVVKDNPRAISFYTKMGLRVIGCGRDADHWLMSGVIR